MVRSETLPARQAALLLHGLPADARGRVLARLSERETARLKPLLSELAELGLSPTVGSTLAPSLNRELQQITPSSAVPAAHGTSARQRAELLSSAEVAGALEACAPVTMAAVLGISAWPWKQEVLESCAELRRAEIRMHLRGDVPALSPAVAEALCERLCQEVAGSWTR